MQYLSMSGWGQNIPDLVFTITISKPPPVLCGGVWQVVRLTARGYGLREIAALLGLRPCDVRKMRDRAMRRLGVRTVSELKSCALDRAEPDV